MIDLLTRQLGELEGGPSLTVPPSVAKVYEMAADLGWACELTFAAGPPANVALRVRRPGHRAYGLWHLVDGLARWQGGASTMRPLRTLTAFRAYLEDVHE